VDAGRSSGGRGVSEGLSALLSASAARRPDATAVVDPDAGAISYGELAALSSRVRDVLLARGVLPGERVGVYLTKSIDAVAAIFGILDAGAAYVPIDPHGPASRNAFILNDCAVSLAFVERRLLDALLAEFQRIGSTPPIIVVDGQSDGSALRRALTHAESDRTAPVRAGVSVAPDDLAYILYTSGSTGRPKGVMLSHRNALGYVNWCSDVFEPTESDRFSSHAPFHFDLSILDIYTPIKHGATLVLVGHEAGKDPARLAPLIAEQRLTVWYSAPSILSLLADRGDLPARDYRALRLVLFAGEVFPVKHLRRLQQLLPHPRYFNLYGPTETNVCTFSEIPQNIPEDRAEPYPIGETCAHLESRIVDESGADVPRGEEGELWIAGANVMQGYWGLPQQTERAFSVDGGGVRWYRTGDLVVESPEGPLLFRGRRDRMIKKRGYRVELGEIEACLYEHTAVREAAVVARSGDDGVTVRAFVATKSGAAVSVIAMKQFCAGRLPLYMVPDTFTHVADLPKTSTDKVDYQRLKEM
ncbi:MAG: amino acid adenylation domain-containing protein, partial [Gemmatimonadaceae bacterium]